MRSRHTPTRCPTCHVAVGWEDNPYRPFCSPRCRMLDLGNWAAERYRIAGAPVPEDDGGGEESTD